MPSIPPPQVGFNNNVRHRGRLFHIQTEDSGVAHPHITTHLFVDGGRILKSVRTDYSADLAAADLHLKIRVQMKGQHRAMFVALRQGELDGLIDEALGIPSEPQGPPVSAHAMGASVSPHSQQSVDAPASLGTAPGPGTAAEQARPSSEPPPPRPLARAERRTAPPPAPRRPPVNAVRRASTHPSPSRRPGLSTDGGSLFGKTSVAEQSLDDVILSYIAEDHDGPTER